MTSKNQNYVRGANFERKAKLWFEKQNFLAVRSAGSHGLFDVVAMDGRTIWLVQCKYGSTDEAATKLVDTLVIELQAKFAAIGYPIVLMVATTFKKGLLHGAARMLMPKEKDSPIWPKLDAVV